MTALMGTENARLTWSSSVPTIYMLCGLQGAGKTTMAGKLANYLQKQGIYKIKEEQLVYFEQTVLPESKMQWLLDKCLFWAKFRFEDIGYKLLPKNSKRRNFIKKIYFSLVKR